MASAEVVYLPQLLEEEFIQFLCRTLEFEESKVTDFHLRVNNVIDQFQTYAHFRPPLLAEIQEYFELLAPTTVDVDLIDEVSLFDKVVLNDRSILNRSPHIMQRLEEVSASLANFADDHPISANQSCRELASNLFSLNKRYQEVVSLLKAVAEEAISLHDALCSLLLKAKDYNHHPEPNLMNAVLRYVGDQIEDLLTLTGYPFSMKKIDIEALAQVKIVFGDLRENIVDQFDPKTTIDLPLGVEQSQLKPESTQTPQLLQRPRGCLLTWQRFFCIPAGYEYDDSRLKSSQSSTSSRSKRSRIQVSGVQKDPSELPDLLSQSESSSKPSSKREEIVISLDDDTTKMVDELTRPPLQLSIAIISGMGGIGKTTLARQVFGHPSIVYHFHLTAWVNSNSSTDQVLSQLLRSVGQAIEYEY